MATVLSGFLTNDKPQAALDGYDNVGGTVVNTASWISVPSLRTVRTQTDASVMQAISLTTARVNVSGLYFISYRCSLTILAGHSRSTSTAAIGINSSPLAGTRSWSYHRQSGNGAGTLVGSALLTLAANTDVSVLAARVSGSANLTLIPDGTGLIITRLY